MRLKTDKLGRAWQLTPKELKLAQYSSSSAEEKQTNKQTYTQTHKEKRANEEKEREKSGRGRQLTPKELKLGSIHHHQLQKNKDTNAPKNTHVRKRNTQLQKKHENVK